VVDERQAIHEFLGRVLPYSASLERIRSRRRDTITDAVVSQPGGGKKSRSARSAALRSAGVVQRILYTEYKEKGPQLSRVPSHPNRQPLRQGHVRNAKCSDRSCRQLQAAVGFRTGELQRGEIIAATHAHACRISSIQYPQRTPPVFCPLSHPKASCTARLQSRGNHHAVHCSRADSSNAESGTYPSLPFRRPALAVAAPPAGAHAERTQRNATQTQVRVVIPSTCL
jgi:hypothetical protein